MNKFKNLGRLKFILTLIFGMYFGTLLANPGMAPQIGSDASGNIVEVWETNKTIMTASLPFGGSWSTATTISFADWPAEDPKMFINEAGNAVAIWRVYDSGAEDNCIHASMYTFGGSWTAPVRISPSDGFQLATYVLKVDNSGNILASWTSFMPGSTYAVYAATAVFGSSWNTAVRLY